MNSVVVRIYDFFNYGPRFSERLVKATTILFVLIILGISLNFIARAMDQANKHNLWGDEHNGLSTRDASYTALLKGDIGSQVSRTPLDYLAQKIFDQLGGRSLLSWGVPPNIYYRLHSIFYIWMSGLLVILVIFFKIRKDTHNYIVLLLQIVGLVKALVFYYFWSRNFGYWIQMRPYALWVSLWFMILALFFVEGRFRWPLVILLILLAWTANAAIYQLFSLAAAFIIMQWLKKEKFSQIMKTVFKIFIIPVSISLYYILMDYSTIYSWSADFDRYLKEFTEFWWHKEKVPLLSVLGILLTVLFKKFNLTTVFLVMLLLYLLGPLINYIVLLRGVFFTSRHYIYYDLIYPVFVIGMVIMLPSFFEKVRSQWQR